MIFGSAQTLSQLGDALPTLRQSVPNVILVVSSADIFPDTDEGKERLKVLSEYFKNSKAVDRETASLHLANAIGNLQHNLASVAAPLLQIFTPTHFKECIERSIENAPAAIPFYGNSGDITFGLVIMGQPNNDLDRLSSLSLVGTNQILGASTQNDSNVKNLLFLHESFHVRKGRSRSDDAEHNDRNAFVEECRADRFAIEQSVSLPNHEAATTDYVHARTLGAVHGVSPGHQTGLAISRLRLDCSDEMYFPYYEAARNFTDKILAEQIADMARDDSPLGTALPPEILRLLAIAKPMTLEQGRSIIERLIAKGVFNGLELDMAEQYLQSNAKWSTPNHTPITGIEKQPRQLIA